MLGRDGPPEIRLHGAVAARARGARRARQGVADPQPARRGCGRDRAVSLPGWLDAAPRRRGAARARRVGDRRARDSRASTLMERAGAGLTEPGRASWLRRGTIAVVCGKGNNGGDGLVVARLLRERGRDVDVLLLGSPDELQRRRRRPTASACPARRREQFEAGRLDGAAAIVDAILGTGFSGAPREPAAGAIAAINAAGARGAVVVACDVPSGVDALDRGGRRRGRARRRDRRRSTRPSPACGSPPARRTPARSRVIDIGIPPGAAASRTIGLIEDRVTARDPARAAASRRSSPPAACWSAAGRSASPARRRWRRSRRCAPAPAT